MPYRALILPPEQRLMDVCNDACRELIARECDPIWNTSGRDYTEEELKRLVSDVDIVVTSWGSPSITDSVLGNANRLRAVAHAAGSVKRLVTERIFERDVDVFSAAPRIAESVAEYCLTAVLHWLNRFDLFDSHVKEGGWRPSNHRRRELAGRQIGIVSASSTARAFMRLLAPFHCELNVYDPYLSPSAAQALGVRQVTLDQVMRCPVISIHAPSIPATEGMLTAELVRAIPDGALLLNSSRASVMEESVFVDELRTGRFFAVLDVYWREPLQVTHPLCELENVILTPHVAGDAVEGHQDLMFEVLGDALRYLEGKGASKYRVNPEQWSILA